MPTLAGAATARLQELIISGELAPGTRLRIAKLAELLGMSPMPIREAIHQLEIRGFVDHVPRRSARVRPLTEDDLADTYEVRLPLESRALERAAERFTQADVEAATRALDEYQAGYARGDLYATRLAHTRFHFALYNASSSYWLARVIQPTFDNSERYRLTALPTRGTVEDVLTEHRRILDACSRHEPKVAVHELQTHLLRTQVAAANRLNSRSHPVLLADVQPTLEPAERTPTYDLVLKGGRVIDPASGIDVIGDVAIIDGKIADVGALPASYRAGATLDVRGKIVTPGLVDLHSHIFHGATYWGINPAPLVRTTGTTTWVDAGSAGGYSIEAFEALVARVADFNVYCFLNIASIGLVGPKDELASLETADVNLAVRAAQERPELVRGIKVRMGVSSVGANGVAPLERAKEAARRSGLPLMVHIGSEPPTLREVLPLLDKGDILTHCFTGLSMRPVDAHGTISDALVEARERGVLLDLGHGSRSFSFRTAGAFAQKGWWPEVISTDISRASLADGAADLPVCLNKLLALGMPLQHAIRAATATPAAILGLSGRIGALAPGVQADIAVFELQNGEYAFSDTDGEVRQAHQSLAVVETFVNGVSQRTPLGEPF